MRRSARLTLTVGLCAVVLLHEVAGARQQTRDTAVPAAPGTGVIAGMVVTDGTDRKPVRRATVTLGSADNNGRSQPPQTMTDDQGRFQFSAVPAGTFSVTAAKPGFLTGFYGARRPGRGPGSPVILAAGQRQTDVTITMTHGASITGVILDQNGRPQPDVRVTVYEARMQNGERTLVTVQSGNAGSVSDDRGVYRMWGLQPGTFFVSATPPIQGAGTVTRLISPDEMQWAAQQLRSAPAAPAPAAGSVQQPSAAASAGPPAPEPGRAVSYAPVFYPGTTDPASAATVSVAPGEERGGIDFSLPLVPTARVEGQVVGPDGQPMFQGVQLTMSPTQSTPISSMTNVTRPSPPDRIGKFAIPAATPGSYRLMARVQGRGATPPGMPPPGVPSIPPPPPPPPLIGGGAIAVIPPAPAPAPAQDLWASVDLTIDGQDLSDVVLQLRPGMTVSGRVVFDGTTLTAPADLTKVRVNLSPIVNAGVSAPPPATAKADATFQVSGAMPGKYRVNGSAPQSPGANGSGPYWLLKSAILNGKDVLDAPFEIQPDEQVRGLVLTFTDRTTELSGALIDASGKPAAGYIVLVVATDRSFWPAATRRIRQIRPGIDGKYRTTGLPPGEYAIGAIVDLDPPDMGDTAFLEQVVAASLKFTLAEGEKKTQDLKLKGGG